MQKLKSIRKRSLSAIIVLGIVMTTVLIVRAADVNVSASPTGGGAYTVNVSTGYVGRVNISTSDGKSGSVWCEGTCEALSFQGSGTVTITASPQNPMSTTNGDSVNASGSSTSITLTQPEPPNNNGNSGNSGNSGNNGGGSNSTNSGNGATAPSNPQTQTPQEQKSKDATLAELNISQGKLDPAFDPEKTSYAVILDESVTSIKVDAKTKDAKASVSGTGERELKPGDNTIDLVVTAEDGTTKIYNIKVSVDAKPDVFTTYNNQKLGVVKALDNVSIPETFEAVKVTLEQKEIDAYRSNLRKLTIVYLVDEKGEKNWYLYDEGTKAITSVYKPIALMGRNLAIIDIPEELQKRTGMTYKEVEVDKNNMMGWTFEDAAFENYILVYLMDDTGKLQYYLYEKTENSLQLYANQAALTQDGYEQLTQAVSNRMIMILALAGTNVLTLLLLMIFIVKNRKNKKKHPLDRRHEVPFQQPVMKKQPIEPFDSWKDEPSLNQAGSDLNRDSSGMDDTALHLKPYEGAESLFESDETKEIR